MADLQWNRAFALEQTAGDEELLDELLQLFRDSSRSDFDQLRQAAADDDVEGIVRAAHSLKGAAASLGLEGIRQLALNMEEGARTGSVEVARSGLEEMRAMLAQLETL